MEINKKRKLKQGSWAILLTLGVIGLSVLTYYFLYKKHWRLDLTEKQELSLSQQTKDVLKNLKDPMTITAFFGPGEDLDDVYIRRRVDDILREYAARASKIDYHMIDSTVDIAKATQFQIHTDGTIVFQAGKNRKDIYKSQLFDFSDMSDSSLPLFTGESQFTNAILKVFQTTQKTICFLEGHGERSVQDSNPEGLTSFKNELTNNNYEIESVSFTKNQEVPTRCAVLVVAGPKRAVTEPEDKAISAWVEKTSGKVLIFIEPLVENPLPKTLSLLEVIPQDDLVFDPERHFLVGPQYPAPVLIPHPITKDIVGEDPVLFSARSLSSSNESLSEILQTSPKAWGETELKSGSKPEFNEGKDHKSPLTLGFAIEDKDKNPRAVVVGDVDFAANALMGAPGNMDLVMNMVGWLVNDKDQVTIRPQRPDYRNITLTAGKAKLISWFTQLIYPLIILLGIGSYWFRRRNR